MKLINLVPLKEEQPVDTKEYWRYKSNINRTWKSVEHIEEDLISYMSDIYDANGKQEALKIIDELYRVIGRMKDYIKHEEE